MKTPAPFLAVALLLAVPRPGCAQAPTPGPTPAAAPGYVETFRGSTADGTALREARTAARVSQRLVNGEAQLLRSYTALYHEIWQNPDGLTPQQACDSLGTKAGDLFAVAGIMANALSTIDPAGLGTMATPPLGYTVATNPDGTVTVTSTKPTPSPAP